MCKDTGTGRTTINAAAALGCTATLLAFFGKDRMAYFKKNGEYIRQVFGLKPPAKKA